MPSGLQNNSAFFEHEQCLVTKPIRLRCGVGPDGHNAARLYPRFLRRVLLLGGWRRLTAVVRSDTTPA